MLSFWILALVSTVSSFELLDYQECTCNYIYPQVMVGIMHKGICYYIVKNNKYPLPKFTWDENPLPIDSKEFLDVFHELTRRFYLKFQTNLLQFPFRQRAPKLKFLMRLPSSNMTNAGCLVYDIRRNLVYDEYNKCAARALFFWESINYQLKSKKEVNRYDKLDRISTPTCFEISTNTSCSLFEIDTKEKFDLYMRHVYKTKNRYTEAMRRNVSDTELADLRTEYHRWSAQIIYFDPTKVSLGRNDYMMHVATFTNYSKPAGCHIADLIRGKIFQQPSCDEAQDVLMYDYHDQRVLKVPRLCKTSNPVCSSL